MLVTSSDLSLGDQLLLGEFAVFHDWPTDPSDDASADVSSIEYLLIDQRVQIVFVALESAGVLPTSVLDASSFDVEKCEKVGFPQTVFPESLSDDVDFGVSLVFEAGDLGL